MIDTGSSITFKNMQISVRDLSPRLKKPCLCLFIEPNILQKVASFNDMDSAVMFMQYLAEMFKAIERIEE